jgi:hypothetical protein
MCGLGGCHYSLHKILYDLENLDTVMPLVWPKLTNSSPLTVPDGTKILDNWGKILEGNLVMNITGAIYVFRFGLDIL